MNSRFKFFISLKSKSFLVPFIHLLTQNNNNNSNNSRVRNNKNYDLIHFHRIRNCLSHVPTLKPSATGEASAQQLVMHNENVGHPKPEKKQCVGLSKYPKDRHSNGSLFPLSFYELLFFIHTHFLCCVLSYAASCKVFLYLGGSVKGVYAANK